MNRFELGQILSLTFTIWFRHFVTFTALAVIAYLPLEGYTAYVIFTDQLDPDSLLRHTVVSAFGGIFLGAILTGALTHAVIQHLYQRPVTLGGSLATGMRRLFPTVVVSILLSCIVMAGCLLLCIPGVYFMVLLFVAIPSSVVERPGILGCLRRSIDLTVGHRWEILGILCCLCFVGFIIHLVYAGIELAQPFPKSVQLALQLLPAVLLAPFQSTCVSVSYYGLRAEKEGTQMGDLSAVFE